MQQKQSEILCIPSLLEGWGHQSSGSVVMQHPGTLATVPQPTGLPLFFIVMHVRLKLDHTRIHMQLTITFPSAIIQNTQLS